MAKIGLNNFRYAILSEASDGTPSYDGAKKPAKAISCTVNITSNSADLYADDALAESDRSFQSGTVNAGIDDEDLETMADLLGHTYSNGVIVRNAEDVAPYVGLGRVVTKMVGGQYKYKVEFLYKVKFAEPNQSDTTKGESVAFNTSELQGSVACLANGDWSVGKTFNRKVDAITYLEALLATDTYTVSFDKNGGTGSVDDVIVAQGSSIALPTSAGLTPPSTKHFAGWGASSDASTTVADPYTPNANVTLYAIWATA